MIIAAENSSLHHRNKLHLKYFQIKSVVLNSNNISLCFWSNRCLLGERNNNKGNKERADVSKPLTCSASICIFISRYDIWYFYQLMWINLIRFPNDIVINRTGDLWNGLLNVCDMNPSLEILNLNRTVMLMLVSGYDVSTVQRYFLPIWYISNPVCVDNCESTLYSSLSQSYLDISPS